MKFYILCFTVLELSLTNLVVSLQSYNGCPPSLQFSTNLKVFRRICYQFIPLEKDWYEARDYCKKYGGHLAKIPDSETNNFIKDELNSLWWKNNGIWIGLNDLDEDGQFTWTNNAANDRLGPWRNWGHGHPGAFMSSHRDCIRIVRNNDWKWHETPCSFPGFKYRFICQYERLQPITIGNRINVALKPAYETTSSISYNMKENFHYDPPVASLIQGQDAIIGEQQGSGHDSKMWQLTVMCLTCLLVLIIIGAILVRKRRQQNVEQMDTSGLKNSSLEQASSQKTKVENIYVDETTQKFLKAKETDKQESIYEEIPYDLDKVVILKA